MRRNFRHSFRLLDFLESRVLLTVTNVPSNGNLQTYINNALPGDTLILPAGATYAGTFTLPNKSGTATITIESSLLASLPAGQRVAPAQANLMPKILSNASDVSALRTLTSAHDYTFLGIEFGTTAASVTISELISLGTSGTAQDTLAEVPTRFTFDRCYIHGWVGAISEKRGIGLNSSDTNITNCYISEIHSSSQDAQALGGYNGPGNYNIINNYLEASGENVLFGGADASIPNLVPTNIVVRFNTMSKPLSWNQNDPTYAGVNYSIKNIFELKNAQNVTVDQNIFENCWVDSQVGFAIVFTPRNQDGGNTWATVANVTFTNNIVRHTAGAFNFLATDDIHPSQPSHDITVANNLWYDIGGTEWGGNGNGFQILRGGSGGNATNLIMEHNTILAPNTFMSFDSGGAFRNFFNSGFVFRNNLVERGSYGLHGPNGEGTVPLNMFSSGIIITNAGSGYSKAPTVTFSGGGGTGAAGTVSLVPFATGQTITTVASIQITNNGTGYTSAPTITFNNTGSGGSGAAATVLTLTSGQVKAWTFDHNVIIGGGYNTSVYPAGDFFPASDAAVGWKDFANGKYYLAAGSAYKNLASDGTDPGVNWKNLDYQFLNPLNGDINMDGIVDGADFDIWFTHLGQHTFAWTGGDLTHDGMVDGADFDVWFTKLGATGTPVGQSATLQSNMLQSPATPTVQPALATEAITPTTTTRTTKKLKKPLSLLLSPHLTI